MRISYWDWLKRECAGPPSCNAAMPAVAQHARKFAHTVLLVRHVVQSVEADHAIEAVVLERQIGSVERNEPHAQLVAERIGTDQPLADFERLARYVDRRHFAAEEREQTRHPACAGTEIEHARAGIEEQLRQQRRNATADFSGLEGSRERLARDREPTSTVAKYLSARAACSAKL